MKTPQFEQPPKCPLVLIIDENPKTIQVVGSILSQDGNHVAAAMDECQALAMIQDRRPDLILLDLEIPKLDGFDLCRRLAKSSVTAEIPVILLTVKTDTQTVVQGFEAGAVDYLAKPFNPEELLARATAHIQLKQAADDENRLIGELQVALGQVKQLSELIPICSHCKQVRDDQGYWQRVEEYIRLHSDVEISYSLCPRCQPQNSGDDPKAA